MLNSFIDIILIPEIFLATTSFICLLFGLYTNKNHGDKRRQHNYYNRHSGEPNRGKAIELEKKRSNGIYNAKILSHIYLW